MCFDRICQSQLLESPLLFNALKMRAKDLTFQVIIAVLNLKEQQSHSHNCQRWLYPKRSGSVNMKNMSWTGRRWIIPGDKLSRIIRHKNPISWEGWCMLLDITGGEMTMETSSPAINDCSAWNAVAISKQSPVYYLRIITISNAVTCHQ